jgi:putative DNA methylase
MSQQLLAAAADGQGGRSFFSAEELADQIPACPKPADAPVLDLVGKATINVALYGILTQADLYTHRQLTALGAFADCVGEVPGWVLSDGGDGVYAAAVASVLGLCVGKLATTNTTQARWYIDNRNGSTTVQAAF